jgi:hypothetical protein
MPLRKPLMHRWWQKASGRAIKALRWQDSAIVLSMPYTLAWHKKLKTTSELPTSNLLRHAKPTEWAFGDKTRRQTLCELRSV